MNEEKIHWPADKNNLTPYVFYSQSNLIKHSILTLIVGAYHQAQHCCFEIRIIEINSSWLTKHELSVCIWQYYRERDAKIILFIYYWSCIHTNKCSQQAVNMLVRDPIPREIGVFANA